VDPTLTQRSLGEANLVESNARIEATPALIMAVDDDARSINIRMSAPAGRITLRTKARSMGNLTIRLSNIHPESTLRLTSNLPALASASSDDAACPSLPSMNACETAGQCPQPVLEPLRNLTSITSVPLNPCRIFTFELAPPPRDQLRFAVIGALEGPAQLNAILDDAIRREPSLDFAIQLGDATDDLDTLADLIDRAPIPFVMIPGEIDTAEGDAAWQRRFGPYDVRWTSSNVQFISFTSIHATLTPRGLVSLESSLRALQDERAALARALNRDAPIPMPLLALTHTPPFDPEGLRDAGFRDRLEAARVTSLLNRYGAHALFAGHLHRPATLTSSQLPSYITSARSSRVHTGDYLLVTLATPPEPNIALAGPRSLRIDRVRVP
jgi:hypothetical protein